MKIVVHDAGRVLLLHRRPERGNFWQPITGSIEEGEAPRETAIRELHEESGLEAEIRDLGVTQSFMIESQYLASRYASPIIASEVVFAASADSSHPVSIDAEEHDDWGWFTFAEAYERIRWSDDREALEWIERELTAPASVNNS